MASGRPFDVVTVPDFSGTNRAVFEARTHVFLASWLEHDAGRGRLPLHLACIGPPPASVRRLADRCGASVTVHDPLPLRRDHHVGNKLRGLEVEPRTERFLLLDIDVAILGGFGALEAFPDCVAASPEDAPNVPAADWERIYAAFGLPSPPRIRPLVHELGLPTFPRRTMGYEAGDAQVAAMLPYYNGGVVFAPWACGLRHVWENSILRIARLFDEGHGTRKWIHHSDQAALAVSIEILRRDGWEFRRLPDAFNTRWQHLYAGTPRLDDVTVLHCCWSFLDSIGPGPVTPARLAEALERFFLVKVRHRCAKVACGDLLRLRPLAAWRRARGAHERAARACRMLQESCRRHGAADALDVPPHPLPAAA